MTSTKIFLRYSYDRSGRIFNFGDDINHSLFSFFCKGNNIIRNSTASTKNFNYDDKISIIGCGSIINYVNSNDIVFGTGCMHGNIIIDKKPKEVIAVRGPLTKKTLINSGIPCDDVFCDPGLLIPFMIPPVHVEHKYDLGIIPHYIDRNLEIIKKYENLPNVLIIDITTRNFSEFVKSVCSCNKILSSSLHGIIIGDAYGIPSHHIVLSNKVRGGTFKFRDYYESCGRPYYNIKLDPNCNIDNMFNQMKEYRCRINLKKIINVFPYINEDIKNACLEKLDNGFMSYLNDPSN